MSFENDLNLNKFNLKELISYSSYKNFNKNSNRIFLMLLILISFLTITIKTENWREKNMNNLIKDVNKNY
jgi:hypothetical protein